MKRRNFLTLSSATMASFAFSRSGFAKKPEQIDAAWYLRSRRFASLPMGRVAYVEYGHGPAALFLHGFPLNSYQWRGALERLHKHRRCIAPDFMGLGKTETPEGQVISPETQVAMLAALLDSLHIDSVDLVANDSGGLVAQLFVARHPKRVRTLLITNCDVDENNPPPNFAPAVALAKEGMFAERFILPQVQNKQTARTGRGSLGSVFTYPDRLTDETIDIYFGPLVESPLRMMQLDQYTVSLGTNDLIAIREDLRQWKGAARIVWAMKDTFFPVASADWLDHTLPGSRGVRRVDGANLFFPEEMPDLIAEEAKHLWGIS